MIETNMTDSNTSTSTARSNAARVRLDRLEKFLQQDPANTALRIDAFETALACSEWARAHILLGGGRRQGDDPLGWALREGDFWLAQKDYGRARAVLEAIDPHAAAEADGVVLHNLAFIDLREGNMAACVSRLALRLEGMLSGEHLDARIETAANTALQRLWLRALHHLGDLPRAITWALDAERLGLLAPQAAGVASLIAIDHGDFAAAQRWSAQCLAQGGAQDVAVEALTAQASLALASRDAARARELARAAVTLNGHEGRAWSAWGYAELLAGDLDTARARFAQAVALMPTHIGTWHGKGWAELLGHDLPAAADSFQIALDLDRNFAESHGGLAVVLALQQRTQEAEAHAERALRIDRSNLSGRYATALLRGEATDAESIQRLARRLLGGRAAPLGGTMDSWLPGGGDGEA